MVRLGEKWSRQGEQHGKYPGNEIVHDTFKELKIVRYG